MYVNGKMRLAETVPGMEGGELKENVGGGEVNYDKILRTFINVTMYPQHNNKKIKKLYSPSKF
jgi:hypothetical protein